MADGAMILLLVSLVLQATQVQSASSLHGCYIEDIRNRHLPLSPGYYDPSALTVEICTNLCGAYQAIYAGLIAGRFCFCGDNEPDAAFITGTSNCSTPCAGDAAQMCGGETYLSVYQSAQPIKRVDLSVSPSFATTGEAVTFSIDVDAGGILTYQMNYDDGNGDMKNNATGMLTKTYAIPGQHDAIVTAMDTAGAIVPKSNVAGLVVQAPVKNITVDCPLFITDEEDKCVAIITQGTHLRLTDNVDGTDRTIDVADPIVDGAGCCVPSTTDPQEPTTEDKDYMMYASEFKYEGVVTHWELWAETTGTLTLLILQPDCTPYCYETNACGACAGMTCTNPNVFCPRAQSCSTGCTPLDRHPCAAPLSDYSIRQTLTLTLTATGYQVIDSQDYTHVYPGDIIAYRKSAGSAALTVSYNQTECDRKYPPTTTNFAKTGGISMPNTRHHLKAIFSSQTKVYLTYTFTTAGTYPLTTNVSNIDIPFSELNVTEIEVLQGINATIIDAPMYWVTNEEGTLNILPHTGTNVKRNWDFGDGSPINDTTTDHYNHTFTTKGEYNVSAISWNQLTSKSNITTVIVEDRIDGFTVLYNPCVTLSNCPFTIQLTGGSDYTIDWDYGDSTTNTTLEADYGHNGIVNHVFTVGGNYTVTANCSNHVSSLIFIFTVVVQEECLGLALVRTGAEKLVDFRIEWTLTQGSDCVFNLDFDGAIIPVESGDIVTKKWQTAILPGKMANKYPLILTVTNMLGSRNITEDFTIETAMKDVSSNCDLAKTGTSIPVTCSVTMTEGSNVVCTWDFDDGTPVDTHDEGPADWAIRTNLVEQRSHSFATGELFNVTITCANNDRSESQHHSVLVIQSVVDVELVHRETIFFAPPGIGAFSFETTGGTPNEATAEFDFGDNFRSTDPLQMDFNYTHEYRDPGCYPITARIWNEVSGKNFTDRQMCVIDPVEDLVVTADPPGAILGQAANIKVIMYRGPSGLFANISCDFGDGSGAQTWQRTGSGQNGEDVQLVTYSTLGTKTITCDITTPLQFETATYQIEVDNPVTEDCVLSTNYPVTHNNPIKFFVECATNPMPTNATVTINQGDGSPPVSVTVPALTAGTLVEIHSYTPASDGHFVAQLTMANGGSSINATLFAGSYIPLTTTSYLCQYQPDVPVGGPLLDGLEGINVKFPTGSAITCTTTLGPGTPVYYVMTAVHVSSSPVVVCNKTTSVFSCMLNEAGQYSVEVKAVNPLGESTPETKTIIMRQPVNNIVVTELTPNAKAGQEKSFSFQFDEMGEESCLNVNFDDGSGTTYNYGDPAYCSLEAAFAGGRAAGSLQNPMTVRFKYDAVGNYQINATIFNTFSATHIYLYHSVSSQDCNKPDITIEDGVTNFRTPLQFQKSKDIVIRGKSNITCASTLINIKLWQVERADKEYGRYNGSTGFTSDKAELVIRAKQLAYGLYKATYSIQMDLADGTTFVGYDYTFFEVIMSDLVVVMEIGGISEVDRGENLPVTFSPDKYSFDPDVDITAPQGFDGFTWSCRIMKNLSLATACDSITGQTGGELTFNTNLFVVGEQIELSCNGSKDTRASVGTILVNIVAGAPLNLYIMPAGSSMTTQLADGKLVSSQERLALEVKCKDCAANVVLNCQWTAYSYDFRWPWRAYFDSEVDPHLVGMKSETIAIKPTMYDLHPVVTKYRFSVKCQKPGGDFGQAALNIQLNRPPQPGTCVITPKASTLTWEGTGAFNVKCSGWQDDNGIAGFTFYSKHKNNELAQQITTYREASDVTIDPPLGADYDDFKEEVWVDVKDSLGAAYSFFIDNVTVTPASVDQIRAWTSNEKLFSQTAIDKLAASGEQKAVTEKMTQIATLLNTESKMSEIEYQRVPGIGPNNEYTSFLAPGDNTVANGMDDATASANLADQAARIEKYNIERDNNAAIRDQIADICANMTTPDPAAMQQVLTCLHTVSSEANECTRHCQLVTLSKTEEIAKELESMTASAEVIKAVGIALLTTTLDAVTSIDVNEEYPTLTDISNAKKSDKYPIYDTDLESSDPSVIGSADPFKQHAKNVHAVEQEEVQSGNSGNVKQIRDVVMKKMAQTLTPGERLDFSTPAVVGTISHVDVGETGGAIIDMPLTRTSLALPASNIFGNLLGENDTAVVSAMATKRDINTYADSTSSLGPDTQYLTVEFLSQNGSVIPVQNTPEPIKIIIAHSSSGPINYTESELHIANWNNLYYTKVNLTGDDSSIHVDVQDLADPDIQVLLVVKMGELSNIEKGICDDVAFIPKTLAPPRTMSYTMDNRKVKKFTGTVWLGFRPVPKGFDSSTITSCADLNKLDLNSTHPDLQLGVYTYTSGCYFFDETTKQWSSDGCYVGDETNYNETVCYCNHLTTFGGGWAVAPNTIDWNFVFANADFYKNPTIYITEMVICVLYLLAVVWARRKDRKDLERLGLTPLKDNDSRDKYYYEVIVVTGMRRNAGTDSKVFLILSGENDETDVRMLGDDKRKVFRRGNVDAFLMTVPEPLGPLNYARVWHDNSGKGKFGSWYLKYLIVRDVQTEQKFVFICNRWFAVEEDDGQVDRVIPVAGLAQMTEFGHLFSERSKKNLVDGHLWFSVVARPPQSRFTRVQRVSCCLCLLFATMLSNAMFYGLADDQPGTAFTFGPFALSPQQIYIGIISNLIVFPANFIVITLFRKSKARKMRPSRLEEALKQMPNRTSASMTDVKPEVGGIWSMGGRTSSQAKTRPESSFSQSEFRPHSGMSQSSEKKKKKKKFEFPWWCRIVGWILLWTLTGVSVAFVTFYGIMFQDEKCKKWITSMLVSFFTSIFVTQPIKVFLTAIIFSLIWKNPGEGEDDKPEDEEEPKLEYDEEYLHAGAETGGFGAARPRKIGYKPPDPEELERARKQRLNEIKMWEIVRELVFYSFFLWILMVISYRSRNPNSYYYKDTLEKMIIKNNHTLQWFTKIHNAEEYWKWARSGMVNAVRASSYYNKDPPLMLRGFIGDKVSRMMGFATMRQLRVEPGLCETIDVMQTVITECNEAYSLFSESKGSFAPDWKPLGVNETARMEYSYRTASDLNGYPYLGLLEVYGGGGYVVELRGSKTTLENKMLELEKENWIDKYTRAVFVEFTVYNPQVNLFAIVTILAEFQPSGGVLTSSRFEPATLLPYMTSVMLFQIVCEVIYFVFTIVFIVKEFRTFLKERTNYFKSFWNLVEISIIIMSVSSIVVYFYRLIVTNSLTNEFKRNHGNEYMKFQYAGYWNEIFSYMIGWLVFFGTLKFLKLLRFNKRMSLLASTLKNGAHSIIHFSVLFWIMFLAFMQLFYLTFKNVSSAFTTMVIAAESGILMMMGKFDIYGMLMVEPILTQVYVFFFVVTCTFILVNMFLSILNETFASVRVDINKQNNDYEIVSFMVNRFKKWTGLGTVANAPPTNATDVAKPPTVEEFPDRIDRLLNSISNVYMDDNIGALLESKGESKKMAMKNMMRPTAPSSTRGGPRIN
ncbi:polycystin-1-like [Haliotis cracherodii]|uniref:polycystin-1-like n=1 Tax=Haliotis cracherodii TaxID=6455 RepID=UPI0039E8A774